MGFNFSDALRERENRARLRGVPMSQKEVSGIAEGYSENAASKLVKQRTLEIEQEKVDAQKKQFDEQMISNEKDREEAKTASRRQSGASAGAAVGTIIGTAVGGAYGAPVGALFGGIIGGSRHCIIISACTSRDSYEVEIAREFRDRYMSLYHLGGYYALAHRIAPLIEKSHFVKLIFKKVLVDRLVDYGEWILEYKPERQLRTSRIVTNGFLSLCAAIGMQIDVQPIIEVHRS